MLYFLRYLVLLCAPGSFAIVVSLLSVFVLTVHLFPLPFPCSCPSLQKHTRRSLAKEGLGRLEEWGMLSVKSGVHGMKEVLRLTKELLA